jgi:hypothetical protein
MTAPEPLLLLLQGGLGNQLLQLVLAQALAERRRSPLVVSTVLLHSQLRQLRGLTPRQLSPLVADAVTLTPQPWHHHGLPRLLARLPLQTPVLNDAALLDASRHNDPLDSLASCQVIHSHGTALLLFSPAFDPQWQRLEQQLRRQHPSGMITPHLALHVRRGDYTATSSGFRLLEQNYYLRALHQAFADNPGLNRQVLLFSDDLQWCMQELSNGPWTLNPQNGSAEADLAQLSQASALIISNSSFSAIAAHLAQQRCPGLSIYAPDKWLLPAMAARLGDLRQSHWQLVTA